ncbi:MAG: type I secretion system permease/ATPase [Methylococcaceae bacterium]
MVLLKRSDNGTTASKWPLWSRSMLTFSFFVNILLLAPSIHLLQVYDRVLTSQSVDTLIYITLIVLAALFFYALGEIIRSRLAARTSNAFITKHSDAIFDYLVHDRANTLDANKVLRDLNTIRTFLAGRVYISLHDLPFFPIFLAFLFLLHFTLGLVAVLGIIVMVIIAVANSMLTKDARQSSQEANNEASSFSIAVMRRTDDIRAMGLLPSIMHRWGGKTASSLNAADDASKSAAFFFGLSKLVRQSLQVLVMAWGASLVLQGDMSGGMMFAASMLLGKTLMPIEQLIGGWDAIMSYRSACKSIKEATAHAQPKHLVELPSPTGYLKIENLVFHPNAEEGQKPVVDDVSFELKPGEIIVMMGPSGAGKSTISRLIVGAIAPTSGTIRLDNFDITQWLEWQRGKAIGYVPQDIMLFPGTVAENIARLEIDPSNEAIIRAAKLAGVHELIAGLPDGYSTEIGPNKIPLSGGQRQRIAMARAFYSDPKVLILDEPNAHLDEKGEKYLMQSLNEAKKNGIAILIVSQRKSILDIADRALMIVNGKIASQKVREPILATSKDKESILPSPKGVINKKQPKPDTEKNTKSQGQIKYTVTSSNKVNK